MTIQDLLNMPVGMTPEQWDDELKRRKRIELKLSRLSMKRDSLEDKLDVLSDEIGSERYNKTKAELDTVLSNIENLRKRL